MKTFTIKVKDKDAELVLGILKKFKAKIIETPKDSKLTLEIIQALKELKQMQDGEIKTLTLEDI